MAINIRVDGLTLFHHGVEYLFEAYIYHDF